MKHFNQLKSFGGRLALVATSFAFSALAVAAPIAAIDVTDAETSMQNQITPMTAILTISLGLSVLVAVFGYIKRVAK